MNRSIDYKTLSFLMLEWILCICALIIAIHFDKEWLYILMAIVIGTRQHAMFILFHDAVHHLFAKNKRLNYFIANLFIGIPLNIPLQAYRGLHIAHHKYVGTENDPERILLFKGQFWNFKPLTFWQLIIQLLSDLLMINILITIIIYLKNLPFFYAQTKQIKIRWYWETFANILIWWSFIAALFWTESQLAWKIILLWNLPILTVNPFFQKIRSFAEHNSPNSEVITNNWTPGIIGRLLIWPYNINYHQIHHSTPNIHWHKLKIINNDTIRKKGNQLIPYILKF